MKSPFHIEGGGETYETPSFIRQNNVTYPLGEHSKYVGNDNYEMGTKYWFWKLAQIGDIVKLT